MDTLAGGHLSYKGDKLDLEETLRYDKETKAFGRLKFFETVTVGKLSADVGLNARLIDFKAEVKQPPEEASKSIIIPVPLVYVGAEFKLVPLVAIEAEARGATYGSSYYYDIVGRAKVKPIGLMLIKPFIALAYRHNAMKIDYSDINAKIRLNGPFIEAGVKF